MTLTIFDIIAIAIACNFWGRTVDLIAILLLSFLKRKYRCSQNIRSKADDE